MKCPNCQKEIKDDSVFCEYCGTRINQSPVNNITINDKESKLGCWVSVLSVLIPIVGFILYFKYKDNDIKKAKQVATLAWIGVAINIVLMYFFS